MSSGPPWVAEAHLSKASFQRWQVWGAECQLCVQYQPGPSALVPAVPKSRWLCTHSLEQDTEAIQQEEPQPCSE